MSAAPRHPGRHPGRHPPPRHPRRLAPRITSVSASTSIALAGLFSSGLSAARTSQIIVSRVRLDVPSGAARRQIAPTPPPGSALTPVQFSLEVKLRLGRRHSHALLKSKNALAYAAATEVNIGVDNESFAFFPPPAPSAPSAAPSSSFPSSLSRPGNFSGTARRTRSWMRSSNGADAKAVQPVCKSFAHEH